MIEVIALKKVIKNKSILNIPNLVFKEGTINGIVGKNGSGKSTLLRIILDFEKPTSGNIFIDNEINHSTEAWKKKIGAYLDEDFLINFLSADEYFELMFKLRGKDMTYYPEFISEMEAFFADEIINQNKLISLFSKGNRQKIGIAGALIGEVNTVIFDEPFSHLDSTAQENLKLVLKERSKKNNLTVIMASHNVSLFSDFFDNIIQLQNGEIVM